MLMANVASFMKVYNFLNRFRTLPVSGADHNQHRPLITALSFSRFSFVGR
jgi:hypothetical protein